MIKLSVLDQSFTRQADQAPIALNETIEMAQWVEQLGYERFWVSEHHAFPSIAGSAPEVLLAALGAATNTIRLGSGGIMLPHYSAYKIAEVFSLLANLYPGRIDLGVGRAPGADMSTAVALATDGRPKFEKFPELLTQVSEYLNDYEAQPIVSPRPPKDIPIWLLGSSADSAQLAAQRGLPYNLALFINPQAQVELISLYKQYFNTSAGNASQQRPYGTVTISVFCADDEDYARLQQRTFDINFYRFVTGQRGNGEGALLSPEQAEDYPDSPELTQFMRSRSVNRAVGNQSQVHAKVVEIAEQYRADEVMVVTNMYEFEDRKQSFKLLKESFSD